MTQKRILFITGGASGIGAALARALVRRGDQVVIADIDIAKASALAQELGPSCAIAIELDVRVPEQWNRALDQAWAHFGSVDVLVNNAGIVRTGFARDLAIEAHRLMLDVNLVGPMTGMLTALPRFKQQGHGHFVTICSMTSFLPLTGFSSYGASKHALRAFHHTLALEERDGPLSFTIFHPAAVETPMLEQEALDDSTAVGFSEKSYSADHVAELIVRAIDHKALEVVMPSIFGRLLAFAGTLPGLVRKLIGHSEAKGRQALAARRRA